MGIRNKNVQNVQSINGPCVSRASTTEEKEWLKNLPLQTHDSSGKKIPRPTTYGITAIGAGMKPKETKKKRENKTPLTDMRLQKGFVVHVNVTREVVEPLLQSGMTIYGIAKKFEMGRNTLLKRCEKWGIYTHKSYIRGASNHLDKLYGEVVE